MLLIFFIVALALMAYWLRRLTIRTGRIEKRMATIDDLSGALDRYNAAVAAREAREQDTITAQNATLAADTQEIADLKQHAVPDDLVQKLNDAAASIEGPAPTVEAVPETPTVEGDGQAASGTTQTEQTDADASS